MGQDQNWEKRYKEWLKQEGLKDNTTAFDVYKSLMEAQDRAKRNLVVDLKARFDNIEEILQETHSERKNQ